jgi:hypothetical protein
LYRAVADLSEGWLTGTGRARSDCRQIDDRVASRASSVTSP